MFLPELLIERNPAIIFGKVFKDPLQKIRNIFTHLILGKYFCGHKNALY